jgi:hypothetical protein
MIFLQFLLVSSGYYDLGPLNEIVWSNNEFFPPREEEG